MGTPKGLAAFSSLLPRVAVGEPALRLKVPATFHAVGYQDPLGYPVSSYLWNWGDGHGLRTTSPTASYTYNVKCSCTVTLTAIDSHGRSGFARVRANVGLPLSTSIVGPTVVHPNRAYNYSAVTTDPNTGGKIRAWIWRSGASTTSTRVVGRAASLRTSFGRLGRQVLMVTVYDTAALQVTKAITVNVVR